MSLGVLTLLIAAGLAGPLLANTRRSLVPVVVGEILAGLVIGRSGFDLVPLGDQTTRFLSDCGFLVLMFSAGTHVPLRDPVLRRALRAGATAMLSTALLAVPLAFAIARIAGHGHGLIWVVLLATGSAAIVAPLLTEVGAVDARGETALAWATIADVATIAALPLVLVTGGVARATLGGLAVTAAAIALFGIAMIVSRSDLTDRIRARSGERYWALDLRLSLLALFALGWLARKLGTSTLVAGFSAGLVVGARGGPARLSTQVIGVANGFFVPLFFVILGAKLDLRALANDHTALLLAALLAGANGLLHLAVARALRLGSGVGLVATAQLGVPAAVASIGLAQGTLSAAQGAAVVAAALVTLGFAAVGGHLLGQPGRAA